MRYLIFDLHFLARSRSRLQIANQQSPIGFYSLLFHLQKNNRKKRNTKKKETAVFFYFLVFSNCFLFCFIFFLICANCFVLLHSHTRRSCSRQIQMQIASSYVALRARVTLRYVALRISCAAACRVRARGTLDAD